MHSFDRTLIAKLGFSDPDKKNPRHDLGCLYLKDPEVRAKLGEWMLSRIQKLAIPRKETEERSTVLEVKFPVPKLEYHLAKGSGQYATTIGFLDARFDIELIVEHYEDSYSAYDRAGRPPKLSRKVRSQTWPLFAEVKIEPVGVGDILRQLNLYRSYFEIGGYSERPRAPYPGVPYGILFTSFQLSPAESTAINEAGYGCIQLGTKFDQWCKEQNVQSDPKDMVI